MENVVTDASIGHNGIAGDQLRAFIERVERIEEEIKELQEDRKEIYQEARSNGFDTKIIRKIVSLRKMDSAKRQEEEAILDLYMASLGMLQDTPLGKAAVERQFGARG